MVDKDGKRVGPELIEEIREERVRDGEWQMGGF